MGRKLRYFGRVSGQKLRDATTGALRRRLPRGLGLMQLRFTRNFRKDTPGASSSTVGGYIAPRRPGCVVGFRCPGRAVRQSPTLQVVNDDVYGSAGRIPQVGIVTPF